MWSTNASTNLLNSWRFEWENRLRSGLGYVVLHGKIICSYKNMSFFVSIYFRLNILSSKCLFPSNVSIECFHRMFPSNVSFERFLRMFLSNVSSRYLFIKFYSSKCLSSKYFANLRNEIQHFLLCNQKSISFYKTSISHEKKYCSHSITYTLDS